MISFDIIHADHRTREHTFSKVECQRSTIRSKFMRRLLDHLVLSGLPIRNEQLYNYLLDHDKTYGLRVVRMRVPSAGANDEFNNEYLLTSHDTFLLKSPDRVDIGYQVLHLLMRDEWDEYDSSSSPIRKFASTAAKDWLSLKFYVIFVDNENTYPFSSSPDSVDVGK